MSDQAHPLAYPRRGYGQDQDRYAWRLSRDRAPIAWPAGRALALMIVVPVEHHVLTPAAKPFKPPGAMQTPYPDLRHYTTRDYGNRVGIVRILKALREAGLNATVPINASQLGRRWLIDLILSEGHEIAAHGLAADALHWGGLDPAEEDARIGAVRAAFDAAGLKPRAWMSPARSQSFATPDLLVKHGFDVCLDWEMDAVPVRLRTDHGPLACVPLSGELDDRALLIDKRQTEAEWRDQILEAADLMISEHGGYGGQALGFTLTPYVSGQPFRIWALREALTQLGANGAIWSATATQIADAAP